MSNKTSWKGWLETEQLERLSVAAEQQKVSVAWLIRHAIDVAYPTPAPTQNPGSKKSDRQK